MCRNFNRNEKCTLGIILKHSVFRFEIPGPVRALLPILPTLNGDHVIHIKAWLGNGLNRKKRNKQTNEFRNVPRPISENSEIIKY